MMPASAVRRSPSAVTRIGRAGTVRNTVHDSSVRAARKIAGSTVAKASEMPIHRSGRFGGTLT